MNHLQILYQLPRPPLTFYDCLYHITGQGSGRTVWRTVPSSPTRKHARPQYTHAISSYEERMIAQNRIKQHTVAWHSRVQHSIENIPHCTSHPTITCSTVPYHDVTCRTSKPYHTILQHKLMQHTTPYYTMKYYAVPKRIIPHHIIHHTTTNTTT